MATERDPITAALEDARTPAEGIAAVRAILRANGSESESLLAGVITAACGGDCVVVDANGVPVNPLARKYMSGD